MPDIEHSGYDRSGHVYRTRGTDPEVRLDTTDKEVPFLSINRRNSTERAPLTRIQLIGLRDAIDHYLGTESR